jgi:hypothetical protein
MEPGHDDESTLHARLISETGFLRTGVSRASLLETLPVNEVTGESRGNDYIAVTASAAICHSTS